MSPLARSTIATVGSGVMAEAMIAGMLRGKLVEPGQVVASHPRLERREHLEREYGIRTVASNTRGGRGRRRDPARDQAPDAGQGRARDRPAPAARPARAERPRRGDDGGPDRLPRPRPGRAQHAQHAGPARQGHDRLVRDARDDRRAASPGGRAARRPRPRDRGRRREDGRHGDRGLAAPARPTSSS